MKKNQSASLVRFYDFDSTRRSFVTRQSFSLVLLVLIGMISSTFSQVPINGSNSLSKFKEIDSALNKSYQALIARNDEDPGFSDALKEAQRAWLKYVDLHLNSVFPLIEGENPIEVYGSNYTAEYEAEKSKLFLQRIELLNGMTVENALPNPPTSTPGVLDPSPALAGAAEQSGIPPLVKGLGVGMSFQLLTKWFGENLKDTTVGYEMLDKRRVFLIASEDNLKYLQKDSKEASAALRIEQLRIIPNGFSEVPSLIVADDRGLIKAISLQPNLVNYLFKAKDIDYSEFKSIFLKSYKLDSLPLQDGYGTFSVTTKDGVKFTVESNKTIHIEKVAEPDKVKKAFD